jgi:hypothetical protein
VTYDTTSGPQTRIVVEVYATWREHGVEIMLHGSGPTASAAAERCLAQIDRALE